MDKEYKYSLQDVFEANRNNLLFEWTQNYLRGEGKNEKLADYLVEFKPTIIKLQEFPLSKLNRAMGPEEGMIFTEPKEKWERRVNGLTPKIKSGVQFPPLIVTDFWKELQISDGSHRHEAFLRAGVRKYWTIFFFKNPGSEKLLESHP